MDLKQILILSALVQYIIKLLIVLAVVGIFYLVFYIGRHGIHINLG